MEIFKHFQHLTLSNDQRKAVEKLQTFLQSDDRVFVLKGYAGSGKTTLLKGLIDYLNTIERKNHLMVPTGRAAKVINLKTERPATTVHKCIYSFDELKEIKNPKEGDISFLYEYKLRNNLEVYNDVFIVDEASMLSDVLSEGEFFRFGSGYLMRDLLSYSRVLENFVSSKIIFIGDPAQLPPIGMNFSPALSMAYILETYGISGVTTEMREVIRQDANNGVLKSATNIRQSLTSGYFNNFDLKENGVDIFNPKYEDFLSVYNHIKGKKIIICYKNKTALDLNKEIRLDKFGNECSIQPEDIVIISSNNYALDVMNGEFAVVTSVAPTTTSREITFRYKKDKTVSVNLIWREVTLLLRGDNNTTRTVKANILENYLYGESYLKPEEQRALYIDFLYRNKNLKKGTEEFKEALKTDEYFNCILLKYGYAVTCHKAQGGEWSNAMVFWDRGTQADFNFFSAEHDKSGKTNAGFYRWAYTAITRTSDKLYCINPPYFNSFSEIDFIKPEVQKVYDSVLGNGQSIEEVNFSDVSAILEQFELLEVPLPIQNHFIERWYNVRKHYIDIIDWQKRGYEIWYQFKRENDTAGIKYWINGKNEFSNNKYQKIPRLTSADKLYDEITKIFNNPIQIEVARNNAEGIISQLEFDIKIEEEKPFLKTLYNQLSKRLEPSDVIKDINHLPYRERYTFSNNGLECIVDFEYKKSGFFGRVMPIGKHCQNPELLARIENIVKNLKNI